MQALITLRVLAVSSIVLSFFCFSSRRRHTRYWRDWSSDVCSSDLFPGESPGAGNRVIVDGQMLSIDEGNRTRRNLIGLGAGHSTVEADMQVYYDASDSGAKLRSEERRVGKESGSRRSPYH